MEFFWNELINFPFTKNCIPIFFLFANFMKPYNRYITKIFLFDFCFDILIRKHRKTLMNDRGSNHHSVTIIYANKIEDAYKNLVHIQYTSHYYTRRCNPQIFS